MKRKIIVIVIILVIIILTYFILKIIFSKKYMCGLMNTESVCYINSSIQLLLGSESFFKFY